MMSTHKREDGVPDLWSMMKRRVERGCASMWDAKSVVVTVSRRDSNLWE